MSSFLIIIIELDSLVEMFRSSENTDEDFDHIISSLILFCNSFNLMHQYNRLALIANFKGNNFNLFPETQDDSHAKDHRTLFIPQHHSLSQILFSRFKNVFEYICRDDANFTPVESVCLSKSISSALCIFYKHINVLKSTFQPRILILQFDKDKELNYNSIMNCIFSAQKLQVIVDALIISKAKHDSHIMQQACFLTGGIYLKHSEVKDLTQLLCTYFLTDSKTRQMLKSPQQTTVDFKASCFCHRIPKEYAYMCSVCLTLLCLPKDRCPVCDTVARK